MDRTLTDAERQLMRHVMMWGSAGYPIRKLGAKWMWGTDAVKGPPTMFKTKRAAIESFEAWRSEMRRLLGFEAREQMISDLKARGFSDEQIHHMEETERAAA